MSNKYTIGVKARFAAGANVIKYNGACYYRLNRQGNSNVVPTSACVRFYPIDPCFHTHSLTGAPLSCYNCAKGEYEFRPNTVFEIPDQDDTLQFSFKPVKDRQYGMFKFMVGSKFYTKNLELSGKFVIFDPDGNDEHIFDTNVYPYSINFTIENNKYCLKYAAKGSYIFVLSVDSADTAAATIPNTGIGSSPLITPTPTPTAAGYGTVPGGPDGITFHKSVSWPSSGTQILAMWYDTSEPQTIELVPGVDKVAKWKDLSRHDRTLESPVMDSFVNSATNIRNPGYLSGGGIGGGPSIVFSVDSVNGGRYLALEESSMDHRAAFIVATFENRPVKGYQRAKNFQSLMTGATNRGGPEACNGNMFTIPPNAGWWNVNKRNVASIYSDTGNDGQDAGQYYICGRPIRDRDLVVKADYMPGVVYEGIRTTGTSPKVDGLCVGSQLKLASGSLRGWNGKVAEIIMLDDEPDARLRQEIEGYLVWKWGLVACLPNDHPWKAGPPVEIPPTPTPVPPPTPTPTAPAPPLPRGVPVGVNLVTTTQLIDVVSQRTYPATLWAGGHYETDWNLINTRLNVLSNNSLKQALTGSIVETINVMTAGDPDIKSTWRSTLYDQTDINCGDIKDTIRLGYPADVIDDADHRVMYCVNRIQVSDSVNFGKTLYDATKDALVPNNPDEVKYPHMWDLFINTLRDVDAGYGDNTVRYPNTTHEEQLKILEKSAQLPLLIETPGFSYNIIDDLQIPLTTLYYVTGKPGASPFSNEIEPLYLSDVTSRVDVAMELMYHRGSQLLWNKPIQIGDESTLEITVDLPGSNDDRSDYVNITGDLPWKINVEMVDNTGNRAVYKSMVVKLPKIAPTYIPNTSSSVVISDMAGKDYKITPYYGDYRADSTESIITNSSTSDLPVLFLRIDRV